MQTKLAPHMPHHALLLEDPFTCGFLGLFDPNLIITPEPSYNGRVAFRVTGKPEQLQAALRALSQDTAIGSLSLITAIKALRSEMFRIKSDLQGVRHE